MRGKDTIFYLYLCGLIRTFDMKRLIFILFFICAAVISASGQSVVVVPGKAQPKPARAWRIVAYNVGVFSKYYDDSMQDIANMMHEIGADAIALCELDSCNRRHPVFQLADFAKAMSADSLGVWSFRYGSAMQWNGGSYGTGVVTDLYVTDSFEIKLPKGDGYEPRVCVVAETPAYVIAAVHLDHSSEKVRMEQASLLTDELVRRYGRSRKPVFLCGDLNTVPGSPTLRQLSKDWKVLSAPSATYPSTEPLGCIDYILAIRNRARFRVLGTGVCAEFESADVRLVSDHLPVYVDVRTNRKMGLRARR